jgi:hypothetical protein
MEIIVVYLKIIFLHSPGSTEEPPISLTSIRTRYFGNFSLHHRVQNGSGAHPASYPMGTRGTFNGGKAAGA